MPEMKRYPMALCVRTLKWFCKHRQPILAYLTTMEAAYSPSLICWIGTHCVNCLMRRVVIIFRKLHNTSEQVGDLEDLAASIVRMWDFEEMFDLLNEEFKEVNSVVEWSREGDYGVCGRYKAGLSSNRKFDEDQGTLWPMLWRILRVKMLRLGVHENICRFRQNDGNACWPDTVVAEHNETKHLPLVLSQDLILQRHREATWFFEIQWEVRKLKSWSIPERCGGRFSKAQTGRRYRGRR